MSSWAEEGVRVHQTEGTVCAKVQGQEMWVSKALKGQCEGRE